MLDDGEFISINKVARLMNEWGIKSKMAKNLLLQQIQKIL
ncbi:hypothetical protein [Legionella tunisiensis]